MTFDIQRYLGTTMEFEGTYRVNGVVTALTGHLLRATLKTASSDADPGIAQITTNANADGQITLFTAESVADAGYRLKFNGAATADQAEGTVLYLDVRVEQPDGDEFIIDPPAGYLNVIRLRQPITRTSP